MLKVGLTGGIASGKSVVGEMLVALGAHLVQADRIAHSLMQPGEAVYNEVVRHFGREILNRDLSVNRAKLAEVAFGPANAPADQRASRIEELNRIVHPVVIRCQEEWMQGIGRQDPRAVAIVEAALILEAGVAKRFDLEAARKEVVRRMAAQLPDEEKIKAADSVIDNSGALAETREQVAVVWQRLRAEADS